MNTPAMEDLLNWDHKMDQYYPNFAMEAVCSFRKAQPCTLVDKIAMLPKLKSSLFNSVFFTVESFLLPQTFHKFLKKDQSLSLKFQAC